MIKLILVLLLLTACSLEDPYSRNKTSQGSADNANPNSEPSGGSVAAAGSDAAALAADAKNAFVTDAFPLLNTDCAACHRFMRTGPAFLETSAAADLSADAAYAAIKASRVIDLNAPDASSLLTKGQHLGPAWKDAEKPKIGGWLAKEAIAAAAAKNTATKPQDFTTTKSTLTNGTVTIDLKPFGLDGSTISLTAAMSATSITLSGITANVGATGAKLLHPILISWTGADKKTPTPDPLDRLSSANIEAAPNTQAPMGSGLLVMSGAMMSDTISFHFDSAAPFAGKDAVVVDTGCKFVSDFVASAVPTLNTNCNNCHGGGNGNATTAFSLRNLNSATAAQQKTVCDTVRSRINLANKPASVLFTNRDPATPNNPHPFTFNDNANDFNTFRTAILTWANKE